MAAETNMSSTDVDPNAVSSQEAGSAASSSTSTSDDASQSSQPSPAADAANATSASPAYTCAEDSAYVCPSSVQEAAPVDLPEDAHAFLAGETRLLAKANWPLADYYVYIDCDPSDKIDFDTFGLLWTDERGFLHFTDQDGHPTHRLSAYPIAWSSDTAAHSKNAMSCAVIYDEDLSRLKKTKARVERAAKQHADSSKYRIAPKNFRSMCGPDDHAFEIVVPEDKAVLNLPVLEQLVKECDDALAELERLRERLRAFLNDPIEHQVMMFNRVEVDNWLDAMDVGEDRSPMRRFVRLQRRAGLTRMSDKTTTWNMACATFDRHVERWTRDYEKKLDTLYDILMDDGRLDAIGQIGLVLEGLDSETGAHLLWRHQFLCAACGAFASTRRSDQIARKFVLPLAEGLSQPWSNARKPCPCPTCTPMRFGMAVPDTTLAERLHHTRWKSKDLKLATSTASRILDLFAKFVPAVGDAMVRAGDPQRLLGGYLLARLSLVDTPEKLQTAADWLLRRWYTLKQWSTLREYGEPLRTFKSETDEFLGKKIPGLNAERLGGLLNTVAGVFVLYAILTHDGKKSAKDYVDIARAATDIARGVIAMNKSLVTAELTSFLESGPTYQELGAASATVAAEDAAKVVSFLKSGLPVVGGVLQLASASISLHEAADKGDKRTYTYSMVQVVGADVALSGIALDVMPEPLVTKGAGVCLNFIGGVIYLSGQVLEFATRPGAAEDFLRSALYYDDGDHSSPDEIRQRQAASDEWYRQRQEEEVFRRWNRR